MKIDASHTDTEDAPFATLLILINIKKCFPQLTIGNGNQLKRKKKAVIPKIQIKAMYQ